MADRFENFSPNLDSPAERGAAIAPNDTTPLADVTRAIYVGGAGSLCVRLVGGDTITLQNVVAGAMYPLRATHVFATGTTATGLVGLR